MAKKEEGPEMLSAGKVAEKLGTTPAKLKKAIADLGIEPDKVRCGCSYYAPETIEKIKSGL